MNPQLNQIYEVIIHMYLKYGIEHTLNMLDGVFAFILLDTNKNHLYVSRDPYGVRPLFQKMVFGYYSHPYIKDPVYLFSSEMKTICQLGNNDNIKQFQPGAYALFTTSTDGDHIFQHRYEKKYFHLKQFPISFSNKFTKDIDYSCSIIKKSLTDAVLKRIDNTDREIACLLSGGLDSSLIAALVQKHSDKKISTWSIGMEGSRILCMLEKLLNLLAVNITNLF